MLGTKARTFVPIREVCLDELVPPDHFYRFLDRILDLSFVRDLVRDRYAEIGRPSIDPVVFFKLQLVMFFEGIRSERQLMATVADRLSVRWYLGYDFGQPLPDHSSLTRIRDRYGLAIFEAFFDHIVELCLAAGLVWGKDLIVDATKIRANADIDTLTPRFYLRAKAHLTQMFSSQGEGEVSDREPSLTDRAVADAPMSVDALAPTPLVTDLTPEACAALVAENAGQWRLLEHRRLDPDRPPRGNHRRMSDFRASTTDPDAAPMNDGRQSALGYQDHYVVDGGKARIILAALVTPADVMENTPLPDLLGRVRFRWKLHPTRVIADTTYGTVENVRLLGEQGIQAFMPLTDFRDRGAYFGQEHFSYDAERDVYLCPTKVALTYVGDNVTTQMRVYRARPQDCQPCPLRTQCTPAKGGRTVTRHVDESFREQVRAYHRTEAYEKAMRKRRVWIEPLFGEAKQWHGLRQFLLRGLEKVNIQGVWVAAGQNLKRWLAQGGWGRRLTPTGGVLTLAVHPAVTRTSRS